MEKKTILQLTAPQHQPMSVIHHQADRPFASMPESTTSVKMTPKIPPTFDGLSSWFEFEDHIDDWVNLTTLTPRKLGPSLKNALVGSATIYKSMLDNAELKKPDSGVDYFKSTLRQYFIKDNQHVFLSRFLHLFRCWRGSREMIQWIGVFEISLKRTINSWMDLMSVTPAYSL